MYFLRRCLRGETGCWRGWPLQMIICKRPAPPDDHLEDAGPFRWSFTFVVCCLYFFVVMLCLFWCVVFLCLLHVFVYRLSFFVAFTNISLLTGEYNWPPGYSVRKWSLKINLELWKTMKTDLEPWKTKYIFVTYIHFSSLFPPSNRLFRCLDTLEVWHSDFFKSPLKSHDDTKI